MEIINELLSDNIGYINALRNAEPLPLDTSFTTEPTSSKLLTLLKFTLISSGLSLLVYIIVTANSEEKENTNTRNI